jgi:TP901 family phage tail tape measure protein
MPDNMGQATLLVNFIGNPAGLITAIKSSKGAIAALKVGAVAASAAILVGFGAAVRAAINFETSMRNVQSIGKFSNKVFESMSASVVKLSQKIPKTAKDLAEGLYFIYSSGFKGKEAMAVLEWSARGAAAGLATTQDSAKALVGVMNAYNKKTAPDAQKFMDIMFKTVDKGVIEFDELAQTLGMVVNTAAVAKVPFEEVGAAIGMMTIKSIPANQATVSLNRVILSFLKPSEQMAAFLREIGYESGELALKELGLEGIMVKIIEATDGNATALRELFPEMRAFRGATALAGSGVAGLTDYFKDFEDTAGSTQAALNEQSKALSFQWQLLKNNATALGITIGTMFLPVLKTMVVWMRKAVQWINSLSPGTKKWITYIALAAASLVILNLVFGSTVRMLGQIALGAGRMLGGLVGLVAAHPVLLLIAAALAAIVYLAFKYPEHFKRISDVVTKYCKTAWHALYALNMLMSGDMKNARKHWKMMKESAKDAASSWDDLWNKAYSTEVDKFFQSRKKKEKEFQRSLERDREMLREQGMSEEQIAEMQQKRQEGFERNRADTMTRSYQKMDEKRKEHFAAELEHRLSQNNNLSNEEKAQANRIIATEQEKHGELKRQRDEANNQHEAGVKGTATRVHNFMQSWRDSNNLLIQASYVIMNIATLGMLSVIARLVAGVAQGFFDIFISIWNWMSRAAGAVAGFMARIRAHFWNSLVAVFTWVAHWFSVIFGTIWNWMSRVYIAIATRWNHALIATGSFVARMGSAVWRGFVSAYQTVAHWMSNIYMKIRSSWGAIRDFVARAVKAVGRAIWDGLGAAWQIVRRFGQKCMKTLAIAWASAHNIVARAINAIIRIINAFIPGKRWDLGRAKYISVARLAKGYNIGSGSGEGGSVEDILAGKGKGIPTKDEPKTGAGVDSSGAVVGPLVSIPHLAFKAASNPISWILSLFGIVPKAIMNPIKGYANPSDTVQTIANYVIEELKKAGIAFLETGLGILGLIGSAVAGLFGAPIGIVIKGLFGSIKALVSALGLVITSGFRPGSVTESGRRSLHASGKAFDVAGSPQAMANAAATAASWATTREVIYAGREWKSGRRIGLRNQHYDHVHIGFAAMGALVDRTRAMVLHKGEVALPARYRKGLEELMFGGGNQKIVYQENHIHVERPEPGADIAARKIAWYLKTEGV